MLQSTDRYVFKYIKFTQISTEFITVKGIYAVIYKTSEVHETIHKWSINMYKSSHSYIQELDKCFCFINFISRYRLEGEYLTSMYKYISYIYIAI